MQTEISKTAPKSVITKLRDEASKNPIFKAVCQGFAIRDRTRAQVTIASLTQKMMKEGFNYSRKDYVSVLKVLADLGFGRLEMSARGKVKSLKDIKITLQSIGRAAVSDSTVLTRANFSNKFKELPEEKAHAKTIAGKIGMTKPKAYKAQLIVHFAKDEITTFTLPNGITEQQLGSFLARYYNSKEI